MIPSFIILDKSLDNGSRSPEDKRTLRLLCVIVFAIGAGPSNAKVIECLGFVLLMIPVKSPNSFLKNADSVRV